ncbi:MAG: amidohydrolase [Bacteroidales bacterium]
MDTLTLALIQTDILWEDIPGNLNRLYPKLQFLKDKCDLVVLPEMFTTGFSMNASSLAESADGITMTTLQKWSCETGLAITGSFICEDNGKTFNRGFFITPVQRFYYDKHHLFRMGNEGKHFQAGTDNPVIPYKGWNISLQICYDLRFPVWCRNVNNRYDLQLFVASWPAVRQFAWETLLKARAIENVAYVAGVNRVGEDGNGLSYKGGSALIDMKGKTISEAEYNQEEILIATIEKGTLNAFRTKFAVWQDADPFELKQAD